jgi:hypothetical protein
LQLRHCAPVQQVVSLFAAGPAKRRTPWLASPAKDATNDNSAAAVAQPQPDQSPGGSPIVAPGRGAPVTAAGRKGRKGGGGRSATSGFRGVTQHRYTQRWEAHLWDPDGVRNKTAGSNRTRGTQVWHSWGVLGAAYTVTVRHGMKAIRLADGLAHPESHVARCLLDLLYCRDIC